MPTKAELAKENEALRRELGSVPINTGEAAAAAAQSAMVESREYGDDVRRETMARNAERKAEAQRARGLSGQDLGVAPVSGMPVPIPTPSPTDMVEDE
jgi:hypothetical protein